MAVGGRAFSGTLHLNDKVYKRTKITDNIEHTPPATARLNPPMREMA
jgi:hypothetical protein